MDIAIFAPFIGVLAWIDYRTHRLPDIITYPLIVSAIIMGALNGYIHLALAGAGVAAFAMYLACLFARGGMGDVKLAAAIGAMFAWPWGLYAIVLAIILGGLAAIYLLASKRRVKSEQVSFAPFLALSYLGLTIWLIVQEVL